MAKAGITRFTIGSMTSMDYLDYLESLAEQVKKDKEVLQNHAVWFACCPGANIGAIARAAGVSRQTLYNWISAQQK